jgi:hypothetical protein
VVVHHKLPQTLAQIPVGGLLGPGNATPAKLDPKAGYQCIGQVCPLGLVKLVKLPALGG